MIGNTYLVKGQTRELEAKLISIREDIDVGVVLVEGQKIEVPMKMIGDRTLLSNQKDG